MATRHCRRVYWFPRDDAESFLWPAFDGTSRMLPRAIKWIRAPPGLQRTPIRKCRQESLEVESVDMTLEKVANVFQVDVEEWPTGDAADPGVVREGNARQGRSAQGRT